MIPRVSVARLALVMAALSIASAARAGEPKGSRWVAADAILYGETSRPGTLLDRLLSDRSTGLIKAFPSYEKTLNRPEVKLGRGVVDFVARSFGTTWDRGLRDLAGGGIVFAVEGDKSAERIFLVITPLDPSLLDKVHAKVLEMARADAKIKGKPDPITVSDDAGTTVYSLSPTEAHAIHDGALIVANGPTTLRKVLERARKDTGSASLMDDPTFADRRKAADPEALAWGFARTDRLRAIDPNRFAGGKPDAGAIFVFGPWLEAIQKGEWATLGLTWTEDRLTAELCASAPKGGYPAALARYFPPKGQGSSRPISPPNTIASGSLWRDFSSIWEVRAEILPPEAVQGLAQLDTQAGTFFGGRDFGTGVLGAVGDHWNFVLADQDFTNAELVPETKFPAFAAVLELKPDDEEFAQRLMAAFQSFIGLANLGAAQTKAPPLMLGSEQVDGLTISTSKFQPEIGRPKGEPINNRYNFTPSAVRVGDRFVISSSLGLARDMVKTLREPPSPSTSVLLAEADGPAIARLTEKNRGFLVTRNMLEKGNAKDQAEAEIDFLVSFLRYLGHATLSLDNSDSSFAVKLNAAIDSR